MLHIIVSFAKLQIIGFIYINNLLIYSCHYKLYQYKENIFDLDDL